MQSFTEEQISFLSTTLKYFTDGGESFDFTLSSPSYKTCFLGFMMVLEVNLIASWKVKGEMSRNRSKIDIIFIKNSQSLIYGETKKNKAEI